ncbi:MAG TPA: hypothetical protein VGE59_00830 [Patescibacteria group bacterium]
METRRGHYFLFFTVLLGLVFFSYLNQLIFRYSVPPGLDAVPHNEVVRNILNGDIGQIFRYHTLWHILTILLSSVTRLPTITAMAWLGPLLLVTSSISLYIFNRRFFSPLAGYTSLLLLGFTSLQPLQTLYDGSFPNVLAAGTVLPLAFILFENIFHSVKKARAIFLFVLGFIILAFSHHLTTLYALATMGIFLLVFLTQYCRQKRISWFLILFVLIVSLLLGFLTLNWLLHSPLTENSVFSLANQFMATSFHYPFIHFKGVLDDPNAIWRISLYPQEIGEAVVYLGIMGFFAGLYFLKKRPADTAWNAVALLIIWSCVLFLGSRMEALAYPVRLARDLAIPLALLSGVFVHLVWSYIVEHGLPRWLFAVIIILIIFLAYPSTTKRFAIATHPSNLVHHLPVDQLASDYLEKNTPEGSKILIFHDNYYLGFFLPNREVMWQLPTAMIPKVLHLVDLKETLKGIDYVYVEERPDRESSQVNNTDITYNYLRSPVVKLVATFEQPEKKIYLFRVVGADK